MCQVDFNPRIRIAPRVPDCNFQLRAFNKPKLVSLKVKVN